MKRSRQTLADCALAWKRGDGVPFSLGPGAVYSRSEHIFKNPVIQGSMTTQKESRKS